MKRTTDSNANFYGYYIGGPPLLSSHQKQDGDGRTCEEAVHYFHLL